MKGVAVTAVAWQKAAEPVAPDEVACRREEDEWVARSRTGDLDAFALIYQRYEVAVFHHACRLLEDADEADDIRQETFVRAYQSLGRFRGDCRLKTYLFAICGNICRDRLRHHRRHPARGYGLMIPETAIHFSDASADACQDPFFNLQRAADAARMRKSLHRLAPPDRELLLLHHVEGMELDAIVAVVGGNRVSVGVRLFRARRRLKDVFLSLLKEEGE